jgi:hypothetical protein
LTFTSVKKIFASSIRAKVIRYLLTNPIVN